MVLGALLAFAPVLATACFDLQKVPLGSRFIDDFEDGTKIPEWNRFQAWRCDTDGGPRGPDGGPPADADGGQSVTCAVEDGGDRDQHGLRADFVLQAPPVDGGQPVAEVVTRTISGTVDITGFKVLAFSAFLESEAAPVVPLPSGTQFQVELGCSEVLNHSVTLLNVPYLTFRVKYPDDPFQLTLGTTTESQTCLGQVDSIHFTIKPEAGNGMSMGGRGTLHLDNITLQN